MIHKSYPIFFALVLILNAIDCSAQLTQPIHQPQVGDSVLRKFVDPDFVLEGPDGAGVTWNMSSLIWTGYVDTVIYRLPDSLEASIFPGANVALQQCDPVEFGLAGNCIEVNEFYQNFSDRVDYLGWIMPMAADNGPSVFTDPAIFMQYPFDYPDSIVDSFAGDFSGFAFMHYEGQTRVRVTGSGTLLLMNGMQFDNVLKVVEEDSLYPSVPHKPYSRSVYWFHPDHRQPLLTYRQYPSFVMAWTIIPEGVNGVPTSQVRDFALWPSLNEGSFHVGFHSESGGLFTWQLSDLSGRFLTGPQAWVSGGGYIQKDFQVELPAGIYFFTLQSPDGLQFSKKLVIHH